MSAVVLSSVIAVAGFFISVGTSAFISGMRWGEMRQNISSINNRLSKIEGMFVMVPINVSPPGNAPPHHGG